MGDRISIQFRKEHELSGILFSHWRGLDLKEIAENYIKKLVLSNIEKSNGKPLSGFDPLDRLEPATVMVSFISEEIGYGERITHDYYIPEDILGGDNSNNGHHIIEIDEISRPLIDSYEKGRQSISRKFIEEIEN